MPDLTEYKASETTSPVIHPGNLIRTAADMAGDNVAAIEAQSMCEGTCEPFLTLHAKPYTRDQTAAAYNNAVAGELLTKEEAELAGAWCTHPLNTPLHLAPYVIGHLLLNRQAGEASNG